MTRQLTSAELQEILEGPLSALEQDLYGGMLKKALTREQRPVRKLSKQQQQRHSQRSRLNRLGKRLDSFESLLVRSHADNTGCSKFFSPIPPLFPRVWKPIDTALRFTEQRIAAAGCLASADFLLDRAEQLARIECLRNKPLPDRAAECRSELPVELTRRLADKDERNAVCDAGQAYTKITLQCEPDSLFASWNH